MFICLQWHYVETKKNHYLKKEMRKEEKSTLKSSTGLFPPRHETRNVKHNVDAFQGLPGVSCRDIADMDRLKTGLLCSHDDELYSPPRAVPAMRRK
jgi:hypothetical protein